MRVKFNKKILGDVLAKALIETADSFEEEFEVNKSEGERLEPGSVKRVLDRLDVSVVWREHGLRRGMLDALFGREPHEETTGYGYTVFHSTVETDEEYKELVISSSVLERYRWYYDLALIGNFTRAEDKRMGEELLERFVGVLFKKLDLIEEEPQGA